MSQHTLQPHYKNKALYLFLILQFFCAFADNALIFAEIATLKSTHSPSWEIPMLQDFFVVGYIVLAPFVALIADKWSKKYVLMIGTIFKAAGAIMLVSGINPLLCCLFIGIGSAIFSPAKYGVLPELVEPEKIVKANGLLEIVTIVALLVGAIMGGVISDYSTEITINIILGFFAIGLLINWYIPHLPAAHPEHKLNPIKAITDFYYSARVAYKNKDMVYAILNTSIFGASAATLRFLVVAWVPIALHNSDNKMPALFNSFVAIGIIVGAIIASKKITFKNTNLISFSGIILGLLVVCLVNVTTVIYSAFYLILIGVFGGMFIIPLNAKVQEDGKKTIGSGHSVAIQNLCENLLMLVMVGGYSYLLKIHDNVIDVAMGLGVFISISVGLTWVYRIIKLKN